MKKTPKDIQIHDEFVRLKVLKFSHKDTNWRWYFECQCLCGNIVTVQGSLLLSGNTQSCGCLKQEQRLSQKLPAEWGVVNQIILGYKRHCRDKGRKFLLTKEQFRNLIERPCYYCGVSKSNNKVTKNCKQGFRYNGIDRLDPKGDYTQDNVVSSCIACNRMKGNLSHADFLKKVLTITENKAILST